MRLLFLIIISTSLIISCKEVKQKTSEKSFTVAEKIANAHGFEHWKNVEIFQFRFGGKKDDPNSGRKWTWNPKTNDVSLVRNGETTTYNRNSMDSIAIESDRAFINDKFWALIPFQLLWDDGLTISEPVRASSPVSQEEFFKIIITYSNEGGYTPGDAYDIYYDIDFIIREWSYRRGNADEPTLSNTFENYQDFDGLKIALEHKRTKDDWNLLIRNVKVEFQE